MKLWGLKLKGTLRSVAFGTRDEMRLWAAQRLMPARIYKDIISNYAGSHTRSMALWKEVRARHPTARMVRVFVVETWVAGV